MSCKRLKPWFPGTSQRQTDAPSYTLTLPLKSCAFGTYVVPKKDDTEVTAAYLLTFDKRSSTLIVEPRTSGSSSLMIHVKAIGTIKFYPLQKGKIHDPIIQLGGIIMNQDALEVGYLKYFDPNSKGAASLLTFRFARKHGEWSSQIYEKLLGLLRSQIPCNTVLSAYDLEPLWIEAANAAELRRHALFDKTWSLPIFPKYLKTFELSNERPGFRQTLRCEPAICNARPLKGHPSLSVPSSNEVFLLSAGKSTPRMSSAMSQSKPVLQHGKTFSPATRLQRREVKSPHTVTSNTEEHCQQIFVSTASSHAQKDIILEYPFSGVGRVAIDRGHLECLQLVRCLDDNLIEFGLKLWLDDIRKSNPGLAEQIHVFSSFFYKKLDVPNLKEGYNSVRKWTKAFDIFQKKFIILPIHEAMHWYLIIIYQPGNLLLPSSFKTAPLSSRKRMQSSDEADGSEQEQVAETWIFTLDSLGRRHLQVIETLKAYLIMEARDKKAEETVNGTISSRQIKVLIQPNHYDCGVYLLHFAKVFMENPAHFCVIWTSTALIPSMTDERSEEGAVVSLREALRTRIQSLSSLWKLSTGDISDIDILDNALSSGD